ncbi:MAG: hypothetical protein AAGM29_23845 [Cyanobacteria bacterium J06588_4]
MFTVSRRDTYGYGGKFPQFGKIKRNMPNPIPAIVMGRLAVGINHQAKGLARALIKDLFLRAIQVSDIAGTKAELVKALNNRVVTFYESFG